MTERAAILREALEKALTEMGLSLDEQAIATLLRYDELLLEGNAVMNLTTVTEAKDVAEKHFADSLFPLCHDRIKENATLIDVGAGAGFPGLVLAIARPDLKVTLLDSTQKRVRFLQETAKTLGVSVNCVHARAEDAARQKQFRDHFDVATSRAVAGANELLELCMPFVKIAGTALCYKGQGSKEEFAAASRALQALQGKIVAIDEGSFSWGSRSLVVVEKTAATPKTYPRKAGTPHAKPL